MDDDKRALVELREQVRMLAVAMGMSHFCVYPDMISERAIEMREEIATLRERLTQCCKRPQ